jgi:hypothetical protein
MTPLGNGAAGAACAVPGKTAKIEHARAIANTVRTMCLSLMSVHRIENFRIVKVRWPLRTTLNLVGGNP